MTSSTSNGAKLRVVGIQTVVPMKPTDPRQCKRIIVPQTLTSAAVLQRRFHVLLCYNKASDEDSGWVVAGRIRESLARALQEQPLLAGRLRWCGESGGDMEIVSNDSGVRLVEAMAVVEVAEMREDREVEGELVSWEEVVEQSPQFSPLFYVQVTNFTCGGYSIGISCSLLLVDPFVLTAFIKKWAHIQTNILSRNEAPKIPTFYLPNHGKPASSPSLLMGSTTTIDSAETLIFKTPTKILTSDSNTHKNLAAFFVDEAERVTGRKMASDLSLVVKVPQEDDKVEILSRQGLLESSRSDYGVSGMSYARTWDELELDNVCFSEGNIPVHNSCWVNSVGDEGSVMIAPSTDAGVRIVITFN